MRTFHWPWKGHENLIARDALMERSGGVCEGCGGKTWVLCRPGYLVVHHKRYAETLTLDDLMLLCDSCHMQAHRRHGAPNRPKPTGKPRTRRAPGSIDGNGLASRVNAYCEQGLTQPQMATREGMPLTSLRLALLQYGYTIQTVRRLVRTGSGEEFDAEAAA